MGSVTAKALVTQLLRACTQDRGSGKCHPQMTLWGLRGAKVLGPAVTEAILGMYRSRTIGTRDPEYQKQMPWGFRPPQGWVAADLGL